MSVHQGKGCLSMMLRDVCMATIVLFGTLMSSGAVYVWHGDLECSCSGRVNAWKMEVFLCGDLDCRWVVNIRYTVARIGQGAGGTLCKRKGLGSELKLGQYH